MEIVRLGQGVDRTGRLAPEAMARTLAALPTVRRGDPRHRRGAGPLRRDVGDPGRRRTATSSSPASATGSAWSPEVVTGDEEARLSFIGATRELARRTRRAPFLVVDIGGGSTELVLGDARCRDQAAVSVDIGCVRMTERHLHDDPPTPEQVDAARADIDGRPRSRRARRCRSAEAAPWSASPVGHHRRRARARPARVPPGRIHPRASPATDVAGCDRLLAMTRDERAALPFMHPGRVDVIGAGALVLAVSLERVAGRRRSLTSEHDILDGIAWEALRRVDRNRSPMSDLLPLRWTGSSAPVRRLSVRDTTGG